jgi:hypothetical protein
MNYSDRQWCGHSFTLAGPLDALRDVDGALYERMPQERYAKANGVPLNSHGKEPLADLALPATTPPRASRRWNHERSAMGPEGDGAHARPL